MVMMKSCTPTAMALALFCAVAPAGCNRNVRLAGTDIPHIELASVTHYGRVLDASATPKDVAYVVLRAIQEDVHAPDESARNRALRIQLETAAVGALAAHKKIPHVSDDEFVYQQVNGWAPTVSHYVDSFETDWAKAEARFKVKRTRVEEVRRVLLPVDDPSGDPHAGAVVAVDVVLEKTNDDEAGMYRVLRVSFDDPSGTIPIRRQATP